jgi:hypothetical protein
MLKKKHTAKETENMWRAMSVISILSSQNKDHSTGDVLTYKLRKSRQFMSDDLLW